MEKKEKDLINRLQKNINKKRSLVDEFYGELNDEQKEIVVKLAEENTTKDEPIELLDLNTENTQDTTDFMWYDKWDDKWEGKNNNFKDCENKVNNNNDNNPLLLLEYNYDKNNHLTIDQREVSIEFGPCINKYLKGINPYLNVPKKSEISNVDFTFENGCTTLSFRVTPYSSLYLNLFTSPSTRLGSINLVYGNVSISLGSNFYTSNLYFRCAEDEESEKKDNSFYYYVTLTNKPRRYQNYEE